MKPEIDAAVARAIESAQFVPSLPLRNALRPIATSATAERSTRARRRWHLALLAAGIDPGDEVITVSMTFVATAAAVLYTARTHEQVHKTNGSLSRHFADNAAQP